MKEHFTKGAIGDLTIEQVNYLLDTAKLFHKLVPKMRNVLIESETAAYEEFDAVLGANQNFAPNRWEYAWFEAEWNSSTLLWQPLDGGRSSSLGGSMFSLAAMNDDESDNDGQGPEGMGLDPADYPEGTEFEMQPIPAGKHVVMRVRNGTSGSEFYSFAKINLWRITCAKKKPMPV